MCRRPEERPEDHEPAPAAEEAAVPAAEEAADATAAASGGPEEPAVPAAEEAADATAAASGTSSYSESQPDNDNGLPPRGALKQIWQYSVPWWKEQWRDMPDTLSAILSFQKRRGGEMASCKLNQGGALVVVLLSLCVVVMTVSYYRCLLLLLVDAC